MSYPLVFSTLAGNSPFFIKLGFSQNHRTIAGGFSSKPRSWLPEQFMEAGSHTLGGARDTMTPIGFLLLVGISSLLDWNYKPTHISPGVITEYVYNVVETVINHHQFHHNWVVYIFLKTKTSKVWWFHSILPIKSPTIARGYICILDVHPSKWDITMLTIYFSSSI